MKKTLYTGPSILTAAATLVAALFSTEVLACASCGCSLNSDWSSQGIVAEPGWRLDLRYDFLNQNQLRSGTGTISTEAASRIMNNGDAQEVEKYTKNHYLTTTLDYSTGADWGLNIQLPYIVRSHSTLGTASDGFAPGPGGGQYDSKTSSLGDVKIMGRYLGFSQGMESGLLFGVKLPTGNHTRQGNSTDPANPDPVEIDRGLQPGTGTTDLILGAFHFGQFNDGLGYFTQALYQTAINSSDAYQPGDSVTVTGGVRYVGFSRFVPLVQLNLRWSAHDSGASADTISTGGTLLYITPGVEVPLGKRISAYGFVQLPLYQNVNGVQLAPRVISSLGMRFAF